LSGLLLIAIGLIFLFNKKDTSSTNPDQTPTESIEPSPEFSVPPVEIVEPGLSPEAGSSDQLNFISPTKVPSASKTTSPKVTARTPVSTKDANGVTTYEIEVTPAPNAGPYDWTRTVSKLYMSDLDGSRYDGKSACELLGFTDSWSNIFNKTVCDSLNFLNDSVIEPLMELSCALNAQNILYDTGRPVEYEFKGGACLIIDRT
jgi:hypothetical protein